MVMQHSITETIRGAIPKELNAKLFLKVITVRFIKNEKVEMSTIFWNLVSIQYKD